MTNDDFKMVDCIVLSSDAAIRAYVHPVRMEILKRLGREELTLSQLATAMGTIPANLSRHIKHLEKAGLLKLVRTRDTGRNLEKYYRAGAKSFRVEQKGELKDKTATALGILRDNLDEALYDGSSSLEGALAYLVSIRLSKSEKKELHSRLEKIVKEYKEVSNDGGENLVLSIAVYPGNASGFSKERIIL